MKSIAEFDGFLKDHIDKYGNPGKGRTSYLSSQICNEFLMIIENKIRQTIIDEIKKAKYYSIIVDSTPDVAHIDQLSIVLRYVDSSGRAVERFITFIPNCGHKAEDMFHAVRSILEVNGLDLKDMRGQSYDNASNMSGQYSGLQACINIYIKIQFD